MVTLNENVCPSRNIYHLMYFGRCDENLGDIFVVKYSLTYYL